MNRVVACNLLATLLFSTSAMADSNDYVFTTYSEQGLRQFNINAGSIGQSGQPRLDALTIGLGYGVTDNWFSDVYVTEVRSGNDAFGFDSAAWQNTLLLTDTQSLVDVSLYTEIEYEQDHSAGYKLTFGPLLQAEFGLTLVNFNLLLQRNYHADVANPLLLRYQWQVKHHWNMPVDVGIQGFGEVGQWDLWATRKEQSHRLGPALFGKFTLGEENVVNYNAAILFDVIDQTHATTLRMQAVLGF